MKRIEEHKAKFAQVHKHKEKKQKMSHKKRNKWEKEVGGGANQFFIIKYFDWFKKTINAREAQIKRTLKS